MPQPLPPGPYERYPLPDGSQLSMYVIPFDKEGRCEAPRTRDALLEDVRTGGYTDVYLFSHGWNNDWLVATNRYRHFRNGYIQMRVENALPMNRSYRPLLVGVYWPGVVLTTAGERPPQMAGAGDTAVMDEEVEDYQGAVRGLAARVPGDRVERFYDLAQRESLTEAEAAELAELVAPLYRTDDDVEWSQQPAPADVLEAWRTQREGAGGEEDLDDFGTVDGGAGGGPQAAGGIFGFDPRVIVRVATVWQMKDRAGVVGRQGVGPMLNGIRQRTDARLHLIGHSYGCKVLMSAMLAADALDAQPADSLLLLQPAVNHLCFADRVPEMDVPGGYHSVLDRVRQPVLTTYSAHDAALTKFFHVALRRSGDRGELRAAADGPPSVFAALGGYGPRAVRYATVEVRDVKQPYPELRAPGAPRVLAVNGTRTISGHGDISNPSTWWALYEQVSEGQWL
jgi:hypothetical protein